MNSHMNASAIESGTANYLAVLHDAVMKEFVFILSGDAKLHVSEIQEEALRFCGATITVLDLFGNKVIVIPDTETALEEDILATTTYDKSHIFIGRTPEEIELVEQAVH